MFYDKKHTILFFTIQNPRKKKKYGTGMITQLPYHFSINI